MVRWLLRCVGEEVGSISEGCGDVAEDPDEPVAAVDLCEDAEARPDEGEEPGVCPDLRGDVAEDPDEPVAGDELDADEDLLVDVTSEGTDADKAIHENATNEDLCVDQKLPASSQWDLTARLVLSIYIAFNKCHT